MPCFKGAGTVAACILTTMTFAACGPFTSGSSQPKLPQRQQVYRDPLYHFVLTVPPGWKIPGKGQYKRISGARAYAVSITTPGNVAGVRFTVDANITASDYSKIPEGKIAPFGASTLHYHHLVVSGWPSIQIQRFAGGQVDGLFTITNTRQYSYSLEMVSGTPPFPSSILSGYHSIVRSEKLPF